MITIKNRLDFIVKEEEKTHTLSLFKTKKKENKTVKDLSSLIEKTVLIKNQIQEQNNIKRTIKPLKSLPEKKKRQVVWL